MTFRVQFVDAIIPNPVVRLDLTELPWRTLVGTRFDPPPLKRAVVDTLLQDGEQIPASAYANRMIVLKLRIELADADEAAGLMQLLHRELDRKTNIIRYQPGTSEPVYFRTFRASAELVDWDPVTREATVRIPAQPFAFGLPVELGTPAVNSNAGFETTAAPWTVTGGAIARSDDVAFEGDWSLKLTPDGVSAVAGARAELVAATPGKSFVRSAWVYSPTGYSDVRPAVIWYNAGLGVISTTTGSNYDVPAGQWTYLEAAGNAPALAAWAQLEIREQSSPPGTAVLYVDDARIRPAVTVSNDPAAALNPQYVDVSGVPGDVEAATQLRNVSLDFYSQSVLFATRRRGNPASVASVVQAEAMIQGTNTTLQPNDSAMSGAGDNFSRCTFGTATMATRLSAFWPPKASEDARGIYRVYMRCRHSVAGDTIDVRLQIAPFGTGVGVTMSTVRLPLVTSLQMIDLGLISVPFGRDPVEDGPSGRQLQAQQYEVRFGASRAIGSGTLDIDYILFVPSDDQMSIIRFGNDAAGTAYVLDSHHDQVYPLIRDAVDHSRDIVVTGGLPSVRPGVTNRIYIARGVGGGGNTVSTAANFLIRVWPRYMHVRPVTS